MFNSQYKQDEYLENNIFLGYKNGFFMDIGSYDGICINNTLYFEKYNNWTGINVEPIKSIYDKLIINRPNNININCAVCNTDGTANFIHTDGYTEMLSGLVDTYNARHLNRLEMENTQHNLISNTIVINTKKIETICSEYNVKHINYLSIDVEGAEFDVIKSINFEKIFIDVIGFENNYDDMSTEIIEYLKKFNFDILCIYSDIFMINKNSFFYNKN
jgi:FkbM family methyltransferase